MILHAIKRTNVWQYCANSKTKNWIRSWRASVIIHRINRRLRSEQQKLFPTENILSPKIKVTMRQNKPLLLWHKRAPFSQKFEYDNLSHNSFLVPLNFHYYITITTRYKVLDNPQIQRKPIKTTNSNSLNFNPTNFKHAGKPTYLANNIIHIAKRRMHLHLCNCMRNATSN